jgi:ribosomal protein S18 acetylase RimI-like enzyme
MKFSTKDEFTQEDWDLIIHLDESFFDYPWKRKQWEEIENNPNYYIILDEAGFILFHLGIDEAHLLKILVEPNSRKQGIAQVLLQKAIKELEIQNIFLEVVEDNDAAIAFL